MWYYRHHRNNHNHHHHHIHHTHLQSAPISTNTLYSPNSCLILSSAFLQCVSGPSQVVPPQTLKPKTGSKKCGTYPLGTCPVPPRAQSCAYGLLLSSRVACHSPAI